MELTTETRRGGEFPVWELQRTEWLVVTAPSWPWIPGTFMAAGHSLLGSMPFGLVTLLVTNSLVLV